MCTEFMAAVLCYAKLHTISTGGQFNLMLNCTTIIGNGHQWWDNWDYTVDLEDRIGPPMLFLEAAWTSWETTYILTLMLLVDNLLIRNDAKKLKNYWNPSKWVLIWKYSTRAFQRIPTWQGLDDFQKSLRPCALDESSLSIGRVKITNSTERLRKWSCFHLTHLEYPWKGLSIRYGTF